MKSNVIENVCKYFNEYTLETIEEAFNKVYKKDKDENELTNLTIKELLSSSNNENKPKKKKTVKRKTSIEEMEEYIEE